jgi:uncharacterized delta-60 repeat protein
MDGGRMRRQRSFVERLETRALLSANIFLTNVGGNAVGEFSTTGTAINAALVPGGGTTYQFVAVSASNLFVSNYYAGTIGEYSLSGATINASLVTGLNSGGIGPFAIAVSGNQLFVANGDGGSPGTLGTIGEYTLGATPGTIASSIPRLVTGLADPGGIAVSGSNLFITDYANGVVGEYTTSGATVNAALVTGLVTPEAIAISGSNLFVTSYSSGTVGEYTLSGTPVNPSLISGLAGPIGIGASGSDLFVDIGGVKVAQYTTSGTLVNPLLISGLNSSLYITVSGSSPVSPPPPPPPSVAELAFAQQPVSTTASSTLSPITVNVEDATGTLLTSDNSNVSLALGIGPAGATLGGTTTVAAINGVATFSDLTLPSAGNYTLAATDGTDIPATSTTFTIKSPTPAESIGGLDTTFGVKGLAGHNVGFTSTNGVAVQPNGQSIILGTSGAGSSQSFGLTRYNADGSLDTSFGTNGVVTANFGGSDQPSAVTLLPDGNILVAGTAVPTSGGSQFALAEFTSAGALDTSFGNGTGEVLTSFSTAGAISNDAARAIAVSAKGTIYVAGSSNAAGKGLDFAVASYNADGSANASFGASGMATLDFAGGDDAINAIALQTNGELVAAGSSTSPATGIASIALARFLPTGAIDTHFGSKGKVTTSVRGVADIASSVAIDRTGKIVIGGLSATGSASDGSLSSDFVVARYTATGAIDRTFGGGPVITPFGQPSAVSQVVIQADGSIVASGKTAPSLAGINPSQLPLALARYTPAGKLDTTFNATGTAIIILTEAATAPLAPAALAGGNFQPSLVSSFGLSSFSITPQDTASSLLTEFNQFAQSSQGVVAVTHGGELLDVGNGGTDTIEALIVTAGVNLATSLIAKLPPAALVGARGMLSVKITEGGSNPASGMVAIQLYASPDGQLDAGLSPFQSVPERIKLRSNQSQTFQLRYTLPASIGNYFVLANLDTQSLHSLNTNTVPAISTSAVQVAAPFVDLAGTALTSVGTPAAGKLATISFSVTNNGNILARSAPIQILASPDGTAANGTQIAEPKLALNLPAGITRKYRLSFKIPTTLPAGTYVLVAVLDPANTLNDPNLTNNVIVGSTQFTVA